MSTIIRVIFWKYAVLSLTTLISSNSRIFPLFFWKIQFTARTSIWNTSDTTRMLHKRYYKAVNQKSSFGDAMITNADTVNFC